jgi:hypothetical protein
MKTVKSIIQNVNVNEVLENDKYGTYEGMTNEQISDAVAYGTIAMMLKKACVENSNKNTNTFGGRATYNYTYEITSEEVINFLRTLYINTTNSFAKQVIETIGKSKFFTQKQLDIVMEEIMKFDLTINF